MEATNRRVCRFPKALGHGRIRQLPVVLPEGHDWLAAEILRRSATQDLYLFHAKRQGDRIL